MMQVEDYLVVTDFSLDGLTKKVKAQCEKGYVPFSGFAIWMEAGKKMFGQPMLKPYDPNKRQEETIENA